MIEACRDNLRGGRTALPADATATVRDGLKKSFPPIPAIPHPRYARLGRVILCIVLCIAPRCSALHFRVSLSENTKRVTPLISLGETRFLRWWR